MSKWVMQTHFTHLCLNSFPMIQRILQGDGFWPLRSLYEDSGVRWDYNFQHGSSFGSVNVHSHTLPHSQVSLSAYALINPFALIANPRLRLWHQVHFRWLPLLCLYYLFLPLWTLTFLQLTMLTKTLNLRSMRVINYVGKPSTLKVDVFINT
jgi:hypothetical protein